MTIVATSNPTCLPGLQQRNRLVPRCLSPWSFLIIAIEVFTFASLIGIYLVLCSCYPEVQRSALRFPYWGWGAAQVALVALGLVLAVLLLRRIRDFASSSAMILAALAAICGLLAAGLKAMEWARWGGPRIIVAETQVSASPLGSVPTRLASPTKADPRQGAKAFAGSCAACHGPAGEGVAQVAPSLRISEFIAKSSDSQVAEVIRNGRLANDPASKTNKAMPARGGNPFLSDGDVAAIVAFLRELVGGNVGGGSAELAPAGPAVPRWVVPPPPPGPAGLAPQFSHDPTPVWLPPDIQAQLPTRGESTFASMAAAFGAFQGLHLLVGIVLSIVLLWQGYASDDLTSVDGLAKFACLHWTMAVVLWGVMFPLLYIV